MKKVRSYTTTNWLRKTLNNNVKKAKSYTMYLIACYTVVNSIPLLYVPRCLNWVAGFTWSGVTSGIMTIYCGSAHSLFEDNLSDNEKSKQLIRITPPTEEEFKVLIENLV
ncbi:hypothetical protein ABK040_008358 [Willaertia magna]